MILDETETAKYLKIVPPWGDAFNKMARKSKIPTEKIEPGRNNKIIIRIPYYILFLVKILLLIIILSHYRRNFP